MLSGARHSYYKIVRDFDLDKYAEMEEQLVCEPDQVWNLVSEDQESILSACIEKLKGHYQELIIFLFDHPNANSKEIAEYFGISKNNAWIRKHRVIQQLQECVQQYF
jgi:DNA-directed RNA polymerase specialized sigma24 family protein